jgi:hypothetical protein
LRIKDKIPAKPVNSRNNVGGGWKYSNELNTIPNEQCNYVNVWVCGGGELKSGIGVPTTSTFTSRIMTLLLRYNK